MFYLRPLPPHRHRALVEPAVLSLGDADGEGAALLVHQHGGAVLVLGGDHQRAHGDHCRRWVIFGPQYLDSICKCSMTNNKWLNILKSINQQSILLSDLLNWVTN